MKSVAFNFRIALPALLCCLALARAAGAQEEDAARAWVKVAPPNEAFTVLMPRMPFPVAERSSASGALNVEGRRYSLRHDNAEYTVWSFKAAKFPGAPGDEREAYLDRCAEIAWDLLIEPYWKKLERATPQELMKYRLTYEGALPSTGHPGRIYHLDLDERGGLTYIYATGSQIYIVAAAGTARELADVKRFIKSFALNLPVPEAAVPAAAAGAGVGSGRGGGSETGSGVGSGEAKETDYNRTFTGREVTQKAQILAKPEPSYTEWARRFSVTGTVRLRLVLLPSGEVGQITPVSRLPHGLTPNAIEAARRIKFTPAVKDGRAVAQYVTFEYNFNIY
jgi:TonB family protein